MNAQPKTAPEEPCPSERAHIGQQNSVVMTLEGSCFSIANSWFDSSSVLPLFVSTLTGSTQLVGLAAAIDRLSNPLGQLIMGPIMKRFPYLPRLIRRIMLLRGLPWMVMILLLFLSPSPMVTMTAFLLIRLITGMSDGMAQLPWMDVLGRTVPGLKRGLVFGRQIIIGGLGALVTGVVVKLVLDSSLSFAASYSILFAGLGGVMLLAIVPMLWLRDWKSGEGARVDVGVHSFKELARYYATMPRVIRENPRYGRMLLIRLLSGFMSMVLPFVILLADELGLATEQITTLIYIQIVGGLAGGLVWGQVSSRLGNKQVILLSHVLGLALCGIAMSLLWLRPTATLCMVLMSLLTFLVGLINGSWTGFTNYTIDIAPAPERPRYLVLNSIAGLPLSLLSYLAGWLASLLGYGWLFGISFAFTAAALLLSFSLLSQKQLLREGQLR